MTKILAQSHRNAVLTIAFIGSLPLQFLCGLQLAKLFLALI